MKLRSLINCATALLTFSALSSQATSADAELTQPTIREVRGSDDGARIFCTVYAPKQMARSKAGLVVHLYGSGGSHKPNAFNVGRPPYDDFRRLLAERGYWLVVPDLGPSSWMNDAACKQLDSVIADMLQRENIDPSRVHLFGTSMGGGSSLIYIMRRPNKIKSLVAVFPMTDFTRWLNETPRYREAVEKAHAISPALRDEALRAISALQHPEAFRNTPVFLLHGDKDTIVPPHHSRDFAALLKERGFEVTLREVAGETHRDEIAEPFQQELADFIAEADK